GCYVKFSTLIGSSPLIWDAMFVAATWAMVPDGKPVFGTPTAFAECHGAFTAAAIPTAYTFGCSRVWYVSFTSMKPRGFPRPESFTTSAPTNGAPTPRD